MWTLNQSERHVNRCATPTNTGIIPLFSKITNVVQFRCMNSKYLGDVGLRGQADHDVQFLQFHVNWVVVFDKEHFDLLLEDLRPEHKQHNKNNSSSSLLYPRQKYVFRIFTERLRGQ